MKVLNKKVWVPIIVLLSLIIVAGIVFVSLWFTIWNTKVTMTATQIGEEQNVKVTWETTKPVDKVTINVKHNGSLVNSVTLKDSSLIAKGNYVIPAYYGKHDVEVVVHRGGGFFTSDSTTAKVFASEYNIAPITATMPVTIFSLSLKEITENYTIPTFVWFKRSGAWDYSQMPDNVYTMPVASYSEINGNKNQPLIYSRTSAWVKELYEINPDSHFNFFYNDFFAYGWMQATVANGIPAENYNVTLLSDGTASFNYFNQHFNNENAFTNYADMKERYETLKEQVAKRGYYGEINHNFEISAGKLREYAYVMAKEEPNVEWWLSRINGTMAPNNAEMYAELSNLPSIKVKDLSTLLNAFSDEEKVQLKKLYKFSDNMFSKAVEEEKEILILLGTWTESEYYFDDYVKALKAYYGDKYVFYYKGHPKNPTNSVPGKQDKLEKLGLIDVDSTIPAELLFFFTPDAFAVGYPSSTFVSLTDEQSECVFNVRKSAFTEAYKENLEFLISKVAANDATYGSVVNNDSCFVLEFIDTTEKDFAIYDTKTNKIKYYKISGEECIEVV